MAYALEGVLKRRGWLGERMAIIKVIYCLGSGWIEVRLSEILADLE
jgi:hypothetical protein